MGLWTLAGRFRGGARFDAGVILAAAFGAALIAVLEEAFWAARDQASEPAVLLAGIGALGLVTAALAWVLRLLLRPAPALALALTLPVLLPIVHLLRIGAFDARLRFHVMAAAPLALAAGAGVAWMARRRRGLIALGCLGVAALLPPAMGNRMVHASHAGAAGRPPDVLLVVLDTVRRDHLSLYGYPRNTTPHLDALAREAQVFDDAWAVAPWTPSSHASMFTGLLPAQHGVDGGLEPPYAGADIPSLPALLEQAGYRTAALPANPHLTGKGWQRGFRWFRPPWRRGEHTLVKLADRWNPEAVDHWAMKHASPALLAEARAWWRGHAGHPRFLFLNLLDAHRPYHPPAAFRRRFLGDAEHEAAARVEQDPVAYHLGLRPTADDSRLLRALYDGELASLDDQLGSFLAWLKARGDLDRTVVVITSDHGERLGERGLVGHELMLDQYLLRVPLLVRYPPRVTPQRVPQRVQLDGLPGYVLYLSGVPGPGYMRERSLHVQRRTLVFAQRRSPDWFLSLMLRKKPGLDTAPLGGNRDFVADGRFAYRAHTLADGTLDAMLVDLESDPEWTRDLSAQRPDVLERLREAAQALPRFRPRAIAVLDEGARDRLRALGYVN